MVVMPQFDAEELAAIWWQREHVTHAFVVPTMMKQMLDEPAFAKTDFSSLTNLAYGGAAMPMQVIRRAIEAFPKTVGFVNAYGQTETTSSLTVLGPDDHRIEGTPEKVELKLKRLNSIGKPLPDVEIRVRDDDGKFLPHGQVGEIIIRTPRIMKGYAGREDDAAPARRMARDRRPRMGRRRRLRVLRRPQGRHDHPRRRKYRARRNRNRPDESSGGRRRRGDRRAVGRMGADRQGLRRRRAKVQKVTAPELERVLPHAAGELQASRARSSSSTRCPRIRSAKSCARSCVRHRRRLTPRAAEKSRPHRRAPRRGRRDRSLQRQADASARRFEWPAARNRAAIHRRAAMARQADRACSSTSRTTTDARMLAIRGAGGNVLRRLRRRRRFDRAGVVESLAVLSKPTSRSSTATPSMKGLELALAADLRVAIASARFAIDATQARRDAAFRRDPAPAAAYRRRPRAADDADRRRRSDGDEAMRLGLVTYVATRPRRARARGRRSRARQSRAAARSPRVWSRTPCARDTT